MAKKEPVFKGKKEEEVKKMSLNEFMTLVPSRLRRSLNRGFSDSQKKILEKIKKGKKDIKTHCRSAIIVPEMIGETIKVYDGRSFVPVTITVDMAGHYIGEFVLTRKRVAHSAPGVGATRSSAAISVK